MAFISAVISDSSVLYSKVGSFETISPLTENPRKLRVFASVASKVTTSSSGTTRPDGEIPLPPVELAETANTVSCLHPGIAVPLSGNKTIRRPSISP